LALLHLLGYFNNYPTNIIIADLSYMYLMIDLQSIVDMSFGK